MRDDDGRAEIVELWVHFVLVCVIAVIAFAFIIGTFLSSKGTSYYVDCRDTGYCYVRLATDGPDPRVSRALPKADATKLADQLNAATGDKAVVD